MSLVLLSLTHCQHQVKQRRGRKQNQIKPGDTNCVLSPHGLLLWLASYRDVLLLETPLFLLEEPSCQGIKMLFLAKNSKLIKLVVHFWTSMPYEDSNLMV